LDKLEVEIMKIIVPQYRFIFWRSRYVMFMGGLQLAQEPVFN
jgi:hypothetical protein